MRSMVKLGTCVLAVGALSVMAGCCCFPPKAPESVPAAPAPEMPAAAAPSPAPLPAPAPMPVPAPAPAPVVTPAPAPPEPLVPPAVAKRIEDLGQKYPHLFTFDSRTGLLRFNSDITFDSGSSVVKPNARVALRELAGILNNADARDRAMTIIGFTDTDRVAKPATIAHLKALGKPANNMGLSEARAEAVAAVLRANGVEPERMTTVGKGTAEPIAPNTTPAGKAQNRRVEIYLTPLHATK